MGWWRSENGILGDTVADILGKALNAIEDTYLREAGRLPTQGEIANLVEFCTCGALRPACGDPKFAYSKVSLGEDDVPRAADCGNQGVMGPASMGALKKGQMANVNPGTGENYSKKDLDTVLDEQLREIDKRLDNE
jgi:hypothetical protein